MVNMHFRCFNWIFKIFFFNKMLYFWYFAICCRITYVHSRWLYPIEKNVHIYICIYLFFWAVAATLMAATEASAAVQIRTPASPRVCVCWQQSNIVCAYKKYMWRYIYALCLPQNKVHCTCTSPWPFQVDALSRLLLYYAIWIYQVIKYTSTHTHTHDIPYTFTSYLRLYFIIFIL